jgi:hypothetical protein
MVMALWGAGFLLTLGLSWKTGIGVLLIVAGSILASTESP